MKIGWLSTGLGLMLIAILSVGPARAQSVDDRIQTLENELTRLKSEQAQVRSEQLEMKKDALAAAAALPNFSYRPGGGMMIEAADKSWSFRASLESHFRLEFEAGQADAGRETGGVMVRRFRPYFYYCVNDCLYELEAGLDLDGWGTGNAKNSTNTGGNSILQRAVVWVHLEKFNPWLPTVYTGADGQSAISSYRQGSSATSPQMEYDLLSRNNGFNTGRWGHGFGLNWQDKDLSGIGIPGRIPLFNIVYATIGEGDDGLQSFRLHKSESVYLNIEPFSKLKNKWIQGLGFEMGAWFCTVDANTNAQNACDRLRIQDNGDGARQTLFDTGANIGKGLTHFLMPGFNWTVGPYRFRAVMGFQHYDGNTDGNVSNPKGRDFLLAHDIFLWSPKGFLTGGNTEPGSILFGTHFERTDVSCAPLGGGGPGAGGCDVSGEFNRNRILLREWDLWYFLANRMSIGVNFEWYDASNVPSNNVQRNLGCVKNNNNAKAGKGCNWADVILNWRYTF
jgi:hypothetical protein